MFKLTKKLLISSAAIVLFTVTNLSFASIGTRIALGGGEINPNGDRAIKLDKLRPSVAYTISCGITATGNTKMHFSITFFRPGDNVVAQLNGETLPGSLTTGVNGAVHTGENKFTIPNFTRRSTNPDLSESLGFMNLDDTVTEFVDCYADAA